MTDDITKHKDWQKWQGALTEQFYYGATENEMLRVLAPLIFAAGQEAEHDAAKQWLPIDTAPKDGTRVIATWNPEIYGKPAERMMPDPLIVRWVADHYKGAGWYDDYGGTPMHVTHWMLLPAPLETGDK